MIKAARLLPFFILIVLLITLTYQYLQNETIIDIQKLTCYILSLACSIIILINFELAILAISALLLLGSIGLLSASKVTLTYFIKIGETTILDIQPIFILLLIFHLILNHKLIITKLIKLIRKNS